MSGIFHVTALLGAEVMMANGVAARRESVGG
jgi:hypothetical protein